MAKKIIPKNSDEVYDVMKKYADDKGWVLSEPQLKDMAERCYLTFESKCWNGISYWPAVAMRWVLTNKPKFIFSPKNTVAKTETVREKILKQQESDKHI